MTETHLALNGMPIHLCVQERLSRFNWGVEHNFVSYFNENRTRIGIDIFSQRLVCEWVLLTDLIPDQSDRWQLVSHRQAWMNS